MTDKNQLLLAIIGTAFLLGGWLSMDIRELRANVDRNAAAIAKKRRIHCAFGGHFNRRQPPRLRHHHPSLLRPRPNPP